MSDLISWAAKIVRDKPTKATYRQMVAETLEGSVYEQMKLVFTGICV